MTITCIGGGGHVTGAQYLLETASGEKYLVECGFFQEKDVEKVTFPYDPKDISAVFLTHAHIDHSGLIPLLCERGFGGSIYSTEPTKDVASLLFSDMVKVMSYEEKEGRGVVLYTESAVKKALSQWNTVPYHTVTSVGSLKVSFYNAGHVLGSASIRIEDSADGHSVAFSGDLGNQPSVLLKPTEYVDDVDVAFVESAYGGRVHESVVARKDLLKQAVLDTIHRKGTLLIPSFAFERTQDILFELNGFFESGEVESIPVFVDSPLAIGITEIYEKYVHDPSFFNPAVKNMLAIDSDVFRFSQLTLVGSAEESSKIQYTSGPKIIIAGAGMSDGGRIRSHYHTYLDRRDTILLFVGFQSPGTLGRALLDGVEEITLQGRKIAVAAERRFISGYSAHADQPLLMKWVASLGDRVRSIVVVQGEEMQSKELANRIHEDLSLDAVVGEEGKTYSF